MGTYRTITLSDRAADEIRLQLTRRRMTARELARRLDQSPSWVSYRLTSTQAIDLVDLERIAAVLEVDVGALIGLEASATDLPDPELLELAGILGDEEELRQIADILADKTVRERQKDVFRTILRMALTAWLETQQAYAAERRRPTTRKVSNASR